MLPGDDPKWWGEPTFHCSAARWRWTRRRGSTGANGNWFWRFSSFRFEFSSWQLMTELFPKCQQPPFSVWFVCHQQAPFLPQVFLCIERCPGKASSTNSNFSGRLSCCWRSSGRCAPRTCCALLGVTIRWLLCTNTDQPAPPLPCQK